MTNTANTNTTTNDYLTEVQQQAASLSELVERMPAHVFQFEESEKIAAVSFLDKVRCILNTCEEF